MRLLFSLLLSSTLFLQGFSVKKFNTTASETDTVKRNLKKDIHFPEPANISKLFYIQRDPNTNTLIYELNTDKSGELDTDNPLHVYWIRYAEKGQREELNYIQRKFAYGVTSKQVKSNQFDIRFVAYKKMPLNLQKSDDGKYHIFATIAKKQAILNRIFVKVEGGSFWIPNIVYVEMKGTDPATGKEIMERFKP
ncbi:DUF4833 domain-containing protein [Mucilaginibacter boryungensis]|uniref:DUF4833 domain-containing protein n=1 Tax=Mucilaginibacter boryungensis TaxID=768480 RepID=A0ABR9XKH6_9SPHI|nr:DUF4833 domain-containing protein [Mucilaginibacter boryungensis]MBE9667549.1 DUF4833 domain-containing protein [Mucilaginibacter boryungensis]